MIEPADFFIFSFITLFIFLIYGMANPSAFGIETTRKKIFKYYIWLLFILILITLMYSNSPKDSSKEAKALNIHIPATESTELNKPNTHVMGDDGYSDEYTIRGKKLFNELSNFKNPKHLNSFSISDDYTLSFF